MTETPPSTATSDPVLTLDEAGQQALHVLTQRISAHPDMPSLGESITAIQRIVRSEQAHMRALTDGVLADPALTAKLLRLINSACYRSAGAGSITSVQRALSLLGFRAVGMLAASLLLFERLPKGSDGARVRATFSHALLAGLLAQELCHSGRDLDNSYLTALFMNLGEMLVSLHFPDEARAIDEALRPGEAAGSTPRGEKAHAQRTQVSRSVLGLSIQELGNEVASQWGWPPELRDHLRRLYPASRQQAVSGQDYLRVLATAASDLSAELHRLLASRDAEDADDQRIACVERFAGEMGGALSVGGPPLQQAVERAVQQWMDLAGVLGLDHAPGRQRPRLTVVPKGGKVPPPPPSSPPKALPAAPPLRANGSPTEALSSDLHAGSPRGTPPAAPPEPPPTRATPAPPEPQHPLPEARAGQPAPWLEALSLALSRASERALSGASIDEVVARILKDLCQALGLQHAVLCLRESAGGLCARHATGPGAREILRHFEVPLGTSSDLFSVLCAHGRVTLISDAGKPAIQARLPTWFKTHVGAPCFLLLPMSIEGRIVGLLYADTDVKDALHLDEQALSMLGTLRNQLLLALRLRGLA